MEVQIQGLEEALRRIIREEIARDREGWLDAREAADYLGVSVPQVHNLVSAGRLPRHGERGHRLRFRRSDLDAYAEARR